MAAVLGVIDRQPQFVGKANVNAGHDDGKKQGDLKGPRGDGTDTAFVLNGVCLRNLGDQQARKRRKKGGGEEKDGHDHPF